MALKEKCDRYYRKPPIELGSISSGFLNAIYVINVDESIITQAQRLMNKYRLSPRDSIHAASAIERRVEILISDEEDFDQVKEIKRKPLEVTLG